MSRLNPVSAHIGLNGALNDVSTVFIGFDAAKLGLFLRATSQSALWYMRQPEVVINIVDLQISMIVEILNLPGRRSGKCENCGVEHLSYFPVAQRVADDVLEFCFEALAEYETMMPAGEALQRAVGFIKVERFRRTL